MKFNAYSLSEILIILGIIGVILAITIPTIIDYFQHQQNLIALKRAYSILQQAENNIYVDYGMHSVYLCAQNDSYCLGDIYKQYLKTLSNEKYIPNTNPEKCFGANAGLVNSTEKHYCIIATDGIIYDFDMEYSTNSAHRALINVDINGTKKPNIFGKDRYVFLINDNKVTPYYNTRWRLCDNGKGASHNNYSCSYEYLTKNSAK